uniref:Uncharacterized protein n=1 Tax=Myoviridae sp. ctshb19 TaxID=2825194 RepID=A0A8S5UG91_9CAUD|nr:MAG TPA: hypothetical protein [Myoviridae sp. ctshb19]
MFLVVNVEFHERVFITAQQIVVGGAVWQVIQIVHFFIHTIYRKGAYTRLNIRLFENFGQFTAVFCCVAQVQNVVPLHAFEGVDSRRFAATDRAKERTHAGAAIRQPPSPHVIIAAIIGANGGQHQIQPRCRYVVARQKMADAGRVNQLHFGVSFKFFQCAIGVVFIRRPISIEAVQRVGNTLKRTTQLFGFWLHNIGIAVNQKHAETAQEFFFEENGHQGMLECVAQRVFLHELFWRNGAEKPFDCFHKFLSVHQDLPAFDRNEFDTSFGTLESTAGEQDTGAEAPHGLHFTFHHFGDWASVDIRPLCNLLEFLFLPQRETIVGHAQHAHVGEFFQHEIAERIRFFVGRTANHFVTESTGRHGGQQFLGHHDGAAMPDVGNLGAFGQNVEEIFNLLVFVVVHAIRIFLGARTVANMQVLLRRVDGDGHGAQSASVAMRPAVWNFQHRTVVEFFGDGVGVAGFDQFRHFHQEISEDELLGADWCVGVDALLYEAGHEHSLVLRWSWD